MRTHIKNIAVLLTLILILGLNTGCDFSVKPTTLNTIAFDTTITITLYGAHTKEKQALLDACSTILTYYELLLSAYNIDSELYKLNMSGGGVMSDELTQIMSKGLRYCELTNGVFDITLGALNVLWDVANRTQPPSQAAVDEALTHCGYKHLHIEENTAYYGKEGLQVDFGGLAKGYVANKLREYLHSQGIYNGAVIALGGGICVLGHKSKSTHDYKIGIQNPHTNGLLPEYLYVRDTCITSSGNYERYFEYNGKRYGHIIDPRTAYPASSDIDMVTVVCDDAVIGDVLSTAFFILGIDDTRALLKSFQGDVAEVIFVLSSGEVIKIDNAS